jgi:hypothetical protein
MLWPLSRVPPQGFELSTNGFADGVQAEVDGEASTAELVQKFRRLNPPSRVPLQGFELSTNGFVDGVQAEVDGEASTAELI